MPQTLTVAVCMANGMTQSDFITPIEILSSLNMADHSSSLASSMGDVPYRIVVEYLAPALGPISGSGARKTMPTINATQTYEDAIESGIQFDIIWVPASSLPDIVNHTDPTPQEEISFLKHQAPGAKYVLSVCLGSFSLATAGILEGKRATTNKAWFRAVESISSKTITWVPKARWVVDGNVWTSSGVTAGSDMALAFVEHLVGSRISRVIRGIFEIKEQGQDDDPFAEFYGLG